MKKNLGQLLVEKGLISQKDLAEALQRQVVFGGRLGTNLMEMGSLSENNLLQILSSQYGIAFAEPDCFQNLPQNVLESIPEDLVAKYGIVPVALEGNRITLAMRDPDKLEIVDEVSFRTGKAVVPAVATELRIVQALEHYYGVKREARYVYFPPVLKGQAGEEGQASESSRPSGKEKELQEGEIIELGPDDFIQEKELDLTPINKGFMSVGNRDEVALTVVRTGLNFLDDVFLFILKGEKAMGWMSGGSAKPVVDFGSLSVPVNTENTMAKVRETRTLSRFDGVEIFESDPWLKELSLLIPKEVILCPLVLKSRVVSILVGFNFRNSPMDEIDAEFLVRVMRKASVAFEILILKSRIIML